MNRMYVFMKLMHILLSFLIYIYATFPYDLLNYYSCQFIKITHLKSIHITVYVYIISAFRNTYCSGSKNNNKQLN